MNLSLNNFFNLFSELRGIARRERDFYQLNPTQVLIFITNRCSSKCHMCTLWRRAKEEREQSELGVDQWKEVLDGLARMGTRRVEFFGGDVLLRKDVLLPLVEHAHRLGMFTELPTNSILMDEQTASALVQAGLDVLWFSLDGMGQTHDEVRGVERAAERVHNAIALMVAARGDRPRPRLHVNCVVHSTNLHNFEQIIPYAEEAGIEEIDFEYVGEIPPSAIQNSVLDGLTPRPFFVAATESVLLNREQVGLLRTKMDAVRRRNGKVQINTGKIDMLTTEEIISGRYPNHRCHICRNLVYLDPYGNVIGCMQFNNYVLGSVLQQPVDQIWRKQRHRTFITAQQRGELEICKFCSIGMHRNYTPAQSLVSLLYEVTRRGRR